MPEALQRVAPVFLDRAELPASGSLSATITAALEASEFLIVLCSPNAVRSRWVNEEVVAFKRMGRADRVICVLVGGDPSEPEDTFPRACLFEVDANGNLDETAPLEPLAADLRKTGDGQRRAMLRVVARILGVRFDDLVRREAARRQQRLIAIAVASTVGMVLMAALAVFGFVQRNEAVRQRAIAEQETASLEQTVTFLIDIFQVSNPATENPRNITALQILERGARRLETERVGRPHIRGRLMSTIGDVYFNLGLYDEGHAELTRALEMLDPDSLAAVEARIALASTAFRQKKYGQVEAMFAGIDRDLGTRFPAAFAQRGETLRWWGNMALFRNDWETAERLYRRALALYLNGKTDTLGLARTQTALANVLMEKDTTGLAESDRLIHAAIKALVATYGSSHTDTILARADLGRLRQIQGRLPESIQVLRGLERDVIRLFGPQHPHVGAVQQNLGSALILARDGRAAERVMRKALASSKAYSGPSSLDFASNALDLSLALAMQKRKEREARSLLASAVSVYRSLAMEPVYRLNVLLVEAEIGDAFGDPVERARACAAASDEAQADVSKVAWWRPVFRHSCPTF